MVAATRYMILGLIVGGPIALAGCLMWLAAFCRDLPARHTWDQRMAWFRSPKSVRRIACTAAGLVVVALGMVPLLLS